MEQAAEEDGTRRRSIRLEPSGTSGLCLGIAQHHYDNPHALFVRQPSAAESCERMGRRRRKSDVKRSTRRRHFTGSNRRALKRTTAGAATFLVKVKAHQGELTNEEADIQADMDISSNNVPMEWQDRTNRAVFTWQESRWKGSTMSYEDRKSTWNSRVRKAIRRGSEKRRCASTEIM